MASNALFERFEKKKSVTREKRAEHLKEKRARVEALPDSNPFKASLLKRLDRAEKHFSKAREVMQDRSGRKAARELARAERRARVGNIPKQPEQEKTTAKETPSAKAKARASEGQLMPAAAVAASPGRSFVDRLVGKRPAAPVEPKPADAEPASEPVEAAPAETAPERESQGVESSEVGSVESVLGEGDTTPK